MRREMLPMPGMKIGAHVEVFRTDASTGRRELVHTSRPEEVCERCGVPFQQTGLVIPRARGAMTCMSCAKGTS